MPFPFMGIYCPHCSGRLPSNEQANVDDLHQNKCKKVDVTCPQCSKKFVCEEDSRYKYINRPR